MYVKFKKFRDEAFMGRGYSSDAAVDVFTGREVTICAGETASIPTGLGVKIPYNFVGLLMPRTSVASQGLMIHSCPIDPGYTGELYVIATNTTKEEITIPANKAICQLMVQPFQHCNFVAADDWAECMGPRRGAKGFGSSDKPAPEDVVQLRLPFDGE
jgi:deoxyuridine 5'-triphosphate nucleotidohydrolase